MIKSMSKNHSFAKRAHSFLQQLIRYMHQQLGPQERRSGNSILPGCVMNTQAMGTEPPEATGASNVSSDFHTLFGFAQELTDNLETQLGEFDSRGLSESMWTFTEEAIFNGVL